MANNKGRGWHGDSEEHHQAAMERDKFNWWPLLFIPLAFFVGMGVDRIATDDARTGDVGIQRGIGGGPGTECPTPGQNMMNP